MAEEENKNPDAAADDAAKAALGQKDKKEDATEGDAEAVEGEEGEGGGKKSKKMLFIIIGAVVLLLGIGGGAAFFLLGGKGEQEEVAIEEAVPEVHYFSLPEMTVNLDDGGAIARYLQLSLVLEVETPEALTELETNLQTPLMDEYQTYLRTLRVEDLQGSAGLYKLRETLLFRTNQITAPLQVKRVLFKNILVQ